MYSKACGPNFSESSYLPHGWAWTHTDWECVRGELLLGNSLGFVWEDTEMHEKHIRCMSFFADHLFSPFSVVALLTPNILYQGIHPFMSAALHLVFFSPFLLGMQIPNRFCSSDLKKVAVQTSTTFRFLSSGQFTSLNSSHILS